jgi:thiamine kinase-like enzyme
MIKAGRDASIFQEAETLLFLQANSQVRTPTLYAAFTQPIKEWTMHFMVMEHLEGETLSAEKWLSLGDKARSTILSRLCEQLQLLRSIPSEGYYGRLHRQGWSPMLNFLRKMQPGMAGPFDTYEEFVAALCSSARLTTAMGCCLKDFDARESYWLPQMESTLLACNGRQPVFTHMDPSIWNTIIRPIPGRQGEEDWEVTLIDWEYTGWFPAWLQTWSFIDKLIMITTDHTLKSEETRQYIGHVVKNLGEDYTEQVDLFRNLAEHIDYGLL